MKIREIHVYAHDLPVANAPFVIASSTVWSLETTLVRLVAEDGTEGWGETCPVGPTYAEAHAGGARAALLEMAPGLIGADLWPLALHGRMDALLNGHHYAKAALDIAAHDLIGKRLGVRVAELLGGAAVERVPSYYSSGVGDPDETARIAADRVAEGYPRLQVKLGGRPVEIDIEALRKVWEAVGDSGVRLAADGNRSWNTRDVLRLSRECADIPFVLEQPCDSVEELARIRPQVQHPIYLDEGGIDLNAVITAAGTGLVDGFGMKVTRIGGLQPMRTFRDLCAARRLPHSCDDAWGGDVIAAACLHVGATVGPGLNEGVWIAAPYIADHYDPRGGIRIEGGHISMPTGPGLGVTPDETLFGAPISSF
ncbi:mandelate racemase/muconate lactonizing enzyme family protein [Saccharopolyspora sp. NFXS83]|uniref:mandelate racemase/muconate lactonizing enzyme family protein n=1 Tax=Saccharopolyspora sp. NFXS83 TaxID=2993560 RepID=UPI00224B370C|nr:mandelate racemase/muconate lactonizing enzyme family protein [Saccharopolyspora sp. NFXS83]MCX2729221.1 mandelate racemase/muconate lactonizing enzyme family protein [Saccharopolyspora sp. NFXS83]